ncbi:hypothetical protein PJ985_01715 [Streptomyces sp. ACA25]|uniref:hypothetical protein n=1 Tax=Streptomyces sp. ACA25 TaxID=3022596 RepID=UPI002307E501|nr:hypothetical protein [Streptomyces sp. ACA25]MDB1086289.1 hypothetical protein [Streptomyces sp. ACA25]
MTAVHDGYWCEVVARSPDAAGEWALGGYGAATPSLALRWLRGQARRLSDALDPLPGHGPFPVRSLRPVAPNAPNPGRVFREWLVDLRYQETQLSALLDGRHISVNAGGPDRVGGTCDADVYYSLSCRPIALDFLNDWRSVTPHYADA